MAAESRGPSEHLTWRELACRDGTAYPLDWRHDRAVALAATFEDIRACTGGFPIAILSAYRTPAHNRKVGGARSSQHLQGRALDLRHTRLTPAQFHRAIRALVRAQLLPLLGGLGVYPTFVHVDVRPRAGGRIAVWSGTQAESRDG